MRTEKEYVRCDGFCIFHCTVASALVQFLRCSQRLYWLHKPKEAAGALNISSEHMQYMCPEERWTSSINRRFSCFS